MVINNKDLVLKSIKKLLDLGVSDKEILDNLIDVGLDKNEATSLISETKESEKNKKPIENDFFDSKKIFDETTSKLNYDDQVTKQLGLEDEQENKIQENEINSDSKKINFVEKTVDKKEVIDNEKIINPTPINESKDMIKVKESKVTSNGLKVNESPIEIKQSNNSINSNDQINQNIKQENKPTDFAKQLSELLKNTDGEDDVNDSIQTSSINSELIENLDSDSNFLKNDVDTLDNKKVQNKIDDKLIIDNKINLTNAPNVSEDLQVTSNVIKTLQNQNNQKPKFDLSEFKSQLSLAKNTSSQIQPVTEQSVQSVNPSNVSQLNNSLNSKFDEFTNLTKSDLNLKSKSNVSNYSNSNKTNILQKQTTNLFENETFDDLWKKGLVVAINSKLNEMKKLKNEIDDVIGEKIDSSIKKEIIQFRVLLDSQKDLIISSNKESLEEKQREITFIIDSKIAELKSQNAQLSKNILEFEKINSSQEEALNQINSSLEDAKKTKAKIIMEMNSDLIKSKADAQQFIDKAKDHLDEMDLKLTKSLELQKSIAESIMEEATSKIESMTISKATDLIEEMQIELNKLKTIEKTIDVDSIDQKINTINKFRTEFVGEMKENMDKINAAIFILNEKNNEFNNSFEEKNKLIDLKIKNLDGLEKLLVEKVNLNNSNALITTNQKK
ncbi:MAG: hypothetical protein PHQ98_03035 [Candidatus ainarchaeum sp.]|nr:hypothetical protein [Candidatus ainarchaeum sp.]